jgi:hypothetical protein
MRGTRRGHWKKEKKMRRKSKREITCCGVPLEKKNI